MMDWISGNEELLSGLMNMAIVAVTAAIAWAKKTEMAERVRNSRHNEAVSIMQLAAEEIFHTALKKMKEATEDGKLSVAEIAEIRVTTIKRAKQLGKQHGVDVAKAIGEQYLPVILNHVIAVAKGKQTLQRK